MESQTRNSAKYDLKLLREEHEVNRSFGKVVDFGPRKEYIQPILTINNKTVCKVSSIQDVIRNWPHDHSPIRLIWRIDTFVLDLQVMGIPISDGHGKTACSVKGFAKLDGKIVAKVGPISGFDVTFDDTPRPPANVVEYLIGVIDREQKKVEDKSASEQSN